MISQERNPREYRGKPVSKYCQCYEDRIFFLQSSKPRQRERKQQRKQHEGGKGGLKRSARKV